jgi:hypothetical protein
MKNWLFSKTIDLSLLFLPVWITWVICFSVPTSFLFSDFPLWLWVITVLLLDVSHVWSTIFRTYLDKEEFRNHKELLVLTPIISFLIFYSLTSYSIDLFWSIMAYFALFHFMKQQYGFLMLYKSVSKNYIQKIFNDKWIIYFSMLYPILYWHLAGDRSFSWFVEGDFFIHSTELITNYSIVFNSIYWLVISAWIGEEIYLQVKKKQTIVIGKMIWLLTTAINWYIGIIYFNSDVAFTLTNVVAHGIPYMVLIFFYMNRKSQLIKNVSISILGIIGMISLTILLAFGEEYLWDGLINKEKQQFFENILPYPFSAIESSEVLAVLIALLSIPQITHYILDGFIWKSNTKNPYLKQLFR